jgi:hypothetical protein
MTGQLDIDWNDLIGQWVQILKDGGIVRTGYVEADRVRRGCHPWSRCPLVTEPSRRTAEALSEGRRFYGQSHIRSERTRQVMPVEAAPCIEVTVDNRASIDHCLNTADERMIDVALQHRTHGILVTCHHEGHFTVGLSETVPFGYTDEHDCWP